MERPKKGCNNCIQLWRNGVAFLHKLRRHHY